MSEKLVYEFTVRARPATQAIMEIKFREWQKSQFIEDWDGPL